MQDKGDAFLFGTTGPADAVQIGVVFLRDVVVENNLDVADVDAAGSYIGGNQNVDLTSFVLLHDFVSLRLAHIPVQAGGV